MKITNVNNLPQPFVSAVERDYKYKDKQYSVTNVIKGLCESILQRRHSDEIEQDVSDLFFAILGTAVHSVLEHAKETSDQLKEEKVVVDMPNGYKLSGIFDLYDAKEKKVTDYKTGSIWRVIYDDFAEYRKQLLIYAYMLRKIGFECNKGEIVLMLKDWSKTKCRYDSNYPQNGVFVKKFHFSEKDFEGIEQYLIERFNEIARLEQLKDEELPECSPEERWAKPKKYAVMKHGRKSAVKVCDTPEEALQYTEKDMYIQERLGGNTKCEEYCTVTKWCPFYQRTYGGKE